MASNPNRRSVGFLNTDQHSLANFEFSFSQTLESNASVSSFSPLSLPLPPSLSLLVAFEQRLPLCRCTDKFGASSPT